MKKVYAVLVAVVVVAAVFIGISLMGPREERVNITSVVTIDGGIVEAPGKIVLDFPYCAVRESVEVTVEEVDPPDLSEDMTGVGRAYDLGPHDLAFNRPVRVTMYYTEEELEEAGITDPSNLMIAVYNETGGIWCLHTSTELDVNERSLTTDLIHFSVATIGGVTFEYEPRNTLSGRVLSDKGETLDYAEVFIPTRGEAEKREWGYVDVADSAGYYRIEFIKAGSYIVKAFGIGKCEPGKGFMYHWQYKEVSFTATSPPYESETLNFALEPAMGDILVTVYDEQCEPAKDCLVKITSAAGPVGVEQISDGVYYACEVPPGACTVTVPKGDKTKTVETVISPGETSSVTVSFATRYEAHIDDTGVKIWTAGPYSATLSIHLIIDVQSECGIYGTWTGTIGGEFSLVSPSGSFAAPLVPNPLSFSIPETGTFQMFYFPPLIPGAGAWIGEACLEGETIVLTLTIVSPEATLTFTFQGTIEPIEEDC